MELVSLCNLIISFVNFDFTYLKDFSVFFKCVVQVIGHIKGRKSCEIISRGVIFLHHKNLAFEQRCVDLLYTL